MSSKVVALDTNIIIAALLQGLEEVTKEKNVKKYEESIGKGILIPEIVLDELYHFIFKKTYRKIAAELGMNAKSLTIIHAMKRRSIVLKVNALFSQVMGSLKADGFIFETPYDLAIEAIWSHHISFADFLLANKYELITGDEDLNKYIKHVKTKDSSTQT
ncbi:MAG: PIN domain-containing protein [Mycoplasmataceae bacterium]|nr:PIN domain-containing protein [Mycoplasmataceae bacterium]